MDWLIISLLVVFSFITLIPIIAKIIRIPVIVTEIIFWILLWKSLLNIIPLDNSIIYFFAEFWLIYLMFLAGLEIKVKGIFDNIGKALLIAIFSVSVPFFVWFFIGDYIWVHPLLSWTIFSTTSLWLIYSLAREFEIKESLSKLLLKSVLFVDIASIFILAFSLTYIIENWNIKIKFFYSFMAILSLFILPFLINKFKIDRFLSKYISDQTRFEMEVRFSFALIFILAAVSEVLWFHSILWAFIAWMITSEITSQTPLVQKKLESFGYWFFIPLFFIFVWAKVDLPELFSNTSNLFVLLLIITLWISSKVIWAWLISRIIGFDAKTSLVIWLLHSVRLSLIIAVAEIWHQLGYINDSVFSIFVLFAVSSAIISPIICKFLLNKKLSWKENIKKHALNS